MNTFINRREFVQRSSVAAASLAGLPWVGRAADAPVPVLSALDSSFVRPPLATFAVVTDTHFDIPVEGNGEHDFTRWAKQALADVQAAGVDFVIHLGDVLNFPPARSGPRR